MTPRDRSPDRLFMRDEQLELIDRSVEQQAFDQETAASDAEDDARRAAYLERLRAMLPELRKIEGFPIGTDEDILALSDPPYYTACPNPFLGEFIAEHGTPYDEATDTYHREPFAADVSEGKNDPIYNAHSYHTKVPHKAIMRYILHYTKPGDIVFDGFCGTGMTGVAAQLCGSPDPAFKAQVEAEWAAAGHEPPEWGLRYAILGDLSPAATFIAYNYNTPVDVQAFEREAKRILDEVDRSTGRAYATVGPDGRHEVLKSVVWAAVFECPACSSDITLSLDADENGSGPLCQTCGARSSRSQLSYSPDTRLDPITNERVTANLYRPVQSSVIRGGRRITRDAIPADGPDSWWNHSDALHVPTELMLFRGESWGDTYRAGYHRGLRRVADLYLARPLRVLAEMRALSSGARHRRQLLELVRSVALAATRLYKYRTAGGGQPAGNNLYVPALIRELNTVDMLRRKLDDFIAAYRAFGHPTSASAITTQSADSLQQLAADAVDYLFVDPPFGGNIMYSESNFIWESWLRVWTTQGPEAIINETQGKSLVDYQRLMERCFQEFHRILKPGRWMTVEFHNSSGSVWNAIQEAIQRAGFVVADVRVLDKQQSTFKQVTSAGAVKQDLVISAYKPRAGFEQRFSLEAGTERGAWDFVRQHLEQLPVFVERNGLVEVIAERQDYLLFDRMVAFHIQRGVTIPLSAAAFYAGLRQRFPERDGMFFTELQAAEYDQRRLEARDVEQLSVFVVDEKSAIAWLRAELGREPQTFQDLQPKFLRELQQSRYEALPELRDILEQNFLEDEATHRWRVPDPGRQADLEALRQRALLAEFATYRASTGKLKRFRIEAVRAGFADLWAERDYRGIIALAERLPDEVVQEDPALLMYYDNAVTRESAG